MTILTKIADRIAWRGRNLRRTAVLACAALAVLAGALAGVALAAQTGATLTSTGPRPPAVTVNVGDSITFTNTDNQNHSVVTKKPGGYAPGGFTSPPIRPGETYSVGFDTPGTIDYVQTGFQHSYKGKIVVRVVGQLAISAAPKTVVYGGSVTIRGTTPLPSTDVTLSARGHGQHGNGNGAWQTVATVPTAADGSFSTAVKPVTATSYRVQAASGQVTSPAVSVSVSPQLLLHATTPRVVRTGKSVSLTGQIIPANAATSLELLAYDTSRRAWKRVATRTLRASGVIVFRFTVPYGQTALRLTVSKQDHLQPGLTHTTSNQTVVVRGTGPVPQATSGRHKKRSGKGH